MTMKRTLTLLILVLVLSACGKHDSEGITPENNSLPKLELKDDTPDLLLTWIDPKGEFRTTRRPSDVPEDGKEMVRVVITTKDEGTTTPLIYIADLRKKQPDGSYSVRSAPRSEWDAAASKRRASRLAQVTPPTENSNPGSGSPPNPGELGEKHVRATVYGAAWCSACHHAKKYLISHGVRVTYKDIEKDPAAAQEMAQKLQTIGKRPGPIPVIDVAGKVFVGFNGNLIDNAIAQAKKHATNL
jgi:glutaredoxin